LFLYLSYFIFQLQVLRRHWLHVQKDPCIRVLQAYANCALQELLNILMNLRTKQVSAINVVLVFTVAHQDREVVVIVRPVHSLHHLAAQSALHVQTIQLLLWLGPACA
jgi:hypothetical protein